MDRLAALRHEFADVQTDFQRLLTELKAAGMAPADLGATVSAEDAEEAASGGQRANLAFQTDFMSFG